VLHHAVQQQILAILAELLHSKACLQQLHTMHRASPVCPKEVIKDGCCLAQVVQAVFIHRADLVADQQAGDNSCQGNHGGAGLVGLQGLAEQGGEGSGQNAGLMLVVWHVLSIC
jgi:hypothetical protein